MELWQSIIILVIAFSIIIYATQVYNLQRTFILNSWLKKKGDEASSYNGDALRKLWGRLLIGVAVGCVLFFAGICLSKILYILGGSVLIIIFIACIFVVPNAKKENFIKH